MADVRSLLWNERLSRRIDHPHASYSAKGALICAICSVQLKSDSLWNGHIRSTQHQMKAQRLRDSVSTNADFQTSSVVHPRGDTIKKRRIDGEESRVEQGTAKRIKSDPGGLPERFFGLPDSQREGELGVSPHRGVEITLATRSATPIILTPPTEGTTESPIATLEPDVDEDEWAAFEADIAQAEEEAPTHSDAIISAPAVSADKLAAQAREEQSTQQESKEVEIAAEKEDAVRKLEEEFEEMAAMESKLRRLKEMREAIRKKGITDNTTPLSIKDTVDINMDESEEENDEADEFEFFHGSR